MRVDLHLHTTVSDGLVTPAGVVERALAGGLDLIAITDHDTADGVAEAVRAAEGTRLTVLGGTELSSSARGKELHILGYGVDPESPEIVAHHRAATSRRRERMEAMVDNLVRIHGIELTMAQVEDAASEQNCMIGRPHLGQALVDAGYVADLNEAFDTLIGDGHSAYVPTELGTPAEAIATIRAAGGVAVWAHPRTALLTEMVGGLVEVGLVGLEVYRPTWPAPRMRRVQRVAREHGLVLTGGSDWHGRERDGALGDFWVRWGQIQPFLEALAATGNPVLQGVDHPDDLA